MTTFVIATLIFVALTIFVSMPTLIRILSASGVLDIPNERSSHDTPVPRGAGLLLIIVLPLAGVAYFVAGYIGALQLMIVVVAAALIGGVGCYDDRHGTSVGARLLIHCVSAVVVVAAILVEQDTATGLARVLMAIFWVVAVVWGLNLYNFMDGIDGIALQQAIFLSAGGVILLAGTESGWSPVLLATLVGCSVLLIWNWSPARIFLGDVGSGFLGFLFAAIALHTVALGEVRLVSWVVLWGAYLIDSGLTLIRRMLRGERWYEAHRTHAYQHLAKRLRSHAAATLVYAAVNVFWLLPWAYLAQARYVSTGICVAVSLLPLTIGALYLGAGTSPERPNTD